MKWYSSDIEPKIKDNKYIVQYRHLIGINPTTHENEYKVLNAICIWDRHYNQFIKDSTEDSYSIITPILQCQVIKWAYLEGVEDIVNEGNNLLAISESVSHIQYLIELLLSDKIESEEYFNTIGLNDFNSFKNKLRNRIGAISTLLNK